MVDSNPNLSRPEKCSRCGLFILPPIYQCPRGHSLCNNCTEESQYMETISSYSLRARKKMRYNPVVKIKLYCSKCSSFYLHNERRRDEELERLVESVKYPCIYKEYGCQFSAPLTFIETHIETCLFIVKRCFWKNCYWHGILLNMKNHLVLDHPIMKLNETESLKNNWTYTVVCKENFFIIKTLLTKREINFGVIYVGQPNKYIFEMNFGSKYKFPVKWKRSIKPLKNCRNSVFKFESSDIFTVDFQFLRQFIGESEENRIYSTTFFKVNILEVEDPKREVKISVPQKRKVNIKFGELYK